MIPNAWSGFDFGLGTDVDMLRKSVNGFAQDRIAPRADAIDRDNVFPRDLWPEMGALGLHGITVEEDYGGSGLGYLEHCVAMEEISRASAAVGLSYGAHSNLCVNQLRRNGSEQQKRKYLPKLISGEHVGALAMSEPGAGSDVVSMRTRADKKGDRYVLNGSKMWITNGPVADTLVIYAKTDRTAGARGITAFIVEKGFKGFAPAQKLDKLGMRGSDTGELIFEDCEVPEENVLPGSTVGLKAPLSCLTQARYGITWGVIGAAQACLAQLLDYTKTRVLFDRPLAANQAIQIRLASMARGITTAQLMSLQLGRLKDAGRMTPAQVSLAKWNNCRMAIDVARDARDMLGGAGISAEYVPIRHALNLESVITYEGTETIHQLTIGRELTGISAF